MHSSRYTLSKSLLQRLLGQDLPAGLLGLKEEFPEEYQVNLLAFLRFRRRRLQWPTPLFQSLEDLRKHQEYLALGDKKYTACSRISDL